MRFNLLLSFIVLLIIHSYANIANQLLHSVISLDTQQQMEFTASKDLPQEWPTTGNPNILLTGGAGYIASHTIVCLLEAGFDVTVADNLVNSNEESLRRVLELTVRLVPRA